MSDQLKYFAERLPATFVYAGIDVEAAGLFAGTRGRQIAGRFTVIPATAFAYGTGEQREQWRALVATMESTLRLQRHKPRSLVTMDEYLYRRSGGMIGSLSQLVRGAAVLAIEDRSESITRSLLDIVPVDYAAERADTTRTAKEPPRRTRRPARRGHRPAGRAAHPGAARTARPGAGLGCVAAPAATALSTLRRPPRRRPGAAVAAAAPLRLHPAPVLDRPA